MRKNINLVMSSLTIIMASQWAVAKEDTGFSAKAIASYVHDDNIYRVQETLATSDSYLSLAPEVNLIGGIGKQKISLTYKGDYAKFDERDDANFKDHDIKIDINLDHSVRLKSNFEFGYQKEHEEPGAFNRLQFDISEYNKYDQKRFLAGVSYGQESATGLFSLDYIKVDKEYTNNNLDFLNFDSDKLSGKFFYRIAPLTQLYLDVSISEFDYKSTDLFTELDNTFKLYQGGISWKFTNKLTGDISVGYQKRDYDNQTITSISGLAYNGEVTWSINSYSELSASAKREAIDSTLQEAGGFLRTSYSIQGNHELTDLLKINFGIGFSDDELVSLANREDQRRSYQIGLDYSVSRFLSLSASYEYEERDSSFDIADFEANIMSLSATFFMD